MMKRIFLYLLLPLIGSAQIMNLPATRAEKEVTDNVSTLTERTYDVYRGNLTQKRLATENTYVFNSAGNTAIFVCITNTLTLIIGFSRLYLPKKPITTLRLL